MLKTLDRLNHIDTTEKRQDTSDTREKGETRWKEKVMREEDIGGKDGAKWTLPGGMGKRETTLEGTRRCT